MAGSNSPRRLIALGIVASVLMSLLVVRVWFLQAVTADETEEIISRVRTRTVRLLPERGRIFDVNGRIVADNKRILTVAIDRSVVRDAEDREEMFTRLSGPLGVPVETLYARADDKRFNDFEELPLGFDVSEEAAAFLLERIEDYPGVIVRDDWRRTYPYGAIGSHIIGYIGAIQENSLRYYRSLGYDPNERVGLYGVEQTYETILRGAPGFVRYEVDAIGRIKRQIERVEPEPGSDLQLAVDFKLQQLAEQALETQLLVRRRVEAGTISLPDGTPDPRYPEVNYYKAPAGSVVILDHERGEVKAMASYPRFDPRWFTIGITADTFARVFPRTDDPDQSILVNRAVSGRYNLGSSFKPFVAYAALNTGQLPGGGEYTFDDRGTYKLQSIPQDRCEQGVKCIFRNAICSSTGAPCRYGTVDVEAAMAVSSDTFFYKIGEQILTERGYEPVLEREVRDFGFGSTTNVDLPYEYAGTVPSRALKQRLADIGAITEESGENYYVGDNVLFAIGQGLLSATPIQVVNAYGALANGGTLHQPRVVRSILTPGTRDRSSALADLSTATVAERVSPADPLRRLAMRDDVREPVIAGMKRVISGPGVTSDYYHKATGENLFRNFPLNDVPLAGKTGTAQGYENLPWNDSSAFGAFSLNPDVPYSAYAYLEKSGFGSQAAAPVVKCVFLALSGRLRMDELVPAEPIDLASTLAATPTRLRSPSCLVGSFADARD